MEERIPYRIIRSRRTTLALQWTQQGAVVRAPRFVSDEEIEAFVLRHRSWLLRQMQQTAPASPPLSHEELAELTHLAAERLQERVPYYAALLNVTYGRVTVRHQRTRWGSCSAAGNLNFNCLLLLAPPQVLDSVVVHELCHRKYMNHSPLFYREVLSVDPDYKKWNAWLKQNGRTLLARLPAPTDKTPEGERT